MHNKKIMKSKEVFSWINPKLKVRKTLNKGIGIFAISNIKKDETLAIFGGYIMTIKEEEKLGHDSGVQISDNFVITAGYISESTDYFNHSCEPNAGFNGQIFLRAMCGIKTGEEVTFDYAMVLYGSTSYKLNCCCGSRKCRKYVTENDWMIPVLQKKYDGYFQYFLQEKINKLKKQK